ncbi:glycosyltransferase family 1 protein [Rhodoglobus sp. NPDC076762]
MPLILVDLLSYTGTKGGMETYARELYRQLGARNDGFEYVGFASSELMKLDQSWFPGTIVDSKISGENRFTWAYGELFAVARYAKKIGADLIHSPATLGPMKSSMPTVITMHDMLYFSHPQYMSTALYTEPVKWMEKRAAKNATRVLTISSQSAGDIQKYLGVAQSRIDLVPLAGTATAPVDRIETDVASEKMILATGNRRPHKNWEGLVRALALVDPAVRPQLVVTGSRGNDPLAPVVAELGLEQWVTLKSWISSEEMAELYARATVLAMPSFCDGFSLPALEAMMAGIPVIMSDLPVYREVAADAAMYFVPENLQSIADTITNAMTQPELLATAIERGYLQAATFSWERTAEGTAASFNAALAR